MPRSLLRLAFDRSARSIDVDGHLHVARSVLTAAGVSVYAGSEIPDAPALGCRPGRLYSLFRPPEELERAAPTLSGKPILAEHQPVTSVDHPHASVIGAVGDVAFDAPNLVGSLTFWDAAAIQAIQDGTAADLSAGYYYTAVAERGTYGGRPYQFRMTKITFNHLAVVPIGRVPGAVVGDAALERTTWMDATAIEDVLKFLSEKLSAQDYSEAEKMLGVESRSAGDPPAAAMDAFQRRRARERVAFDRRFPDAARVRVL